MKVVSTPPPITFTLHFYLNPMFVLRNFSLFILIWCNCFCAIKNAPNSSDKIFSILGSETSKSTTAHLPASNKDPEL